MMMNHSNTPNQTLDALRYIADSAQQIFNEVPLYKPFHENFIDFYEIYQERLESYTMGAPSDLFPDLDDDMIALLYNAIAAEILRLHLLKD